MLRIWVNGAHGKMGRITVDTIQASSDCELVGTSTRNDPFAECLAAHTPDIVVDFTTPTCVFENAKIILQSGARPVIGTTGLSSEQLDILRAMCHQQHRGALVVPNFSIGAILMMRYAQDAARYFSYAEIIETHHPQKHDAPSGTAIKTAAMMAENFTPAPNTHADKPAQGERHHGILIHSMRLAGVFAEQAVTLGGPGETLTLSHRATDRQSMMPGVILACHKVMELDHLVYGLESLLTAKPGIAQA